MEEPRDTALFNGHDDDIQGRVEGAAGVSRALRSAIEAADQLLALAIGQRAQEAVHLRRPCELRRLGDDVFDPHPPRGELPLQPCPSAPDLIRVPQRTHALIERSPQSWSARIARHGPILGDPL
jgi:hypothetical protein